MVQSILSLKWGMHMQAFSSALASVRLKKSFTDVTLACEGKFFQVHKFVLSTCSEYFEHMFEQTQCKHPVIVLKDIRSEDLESLLSYMYIGEVDVIQDKLSNLIKAAESLRIKGLAAPDEDTHHRAKRSSDEYFYSDPKRHRHDIPRSTSVNYGRDDHGSQDQTAIKEESKAYEENAYNNNFNMPSASSSVKIPPTTTALHQPTFHQPTFHQPTFHQPTFHQESSQYHHQSPIPSPATMSLQNSYQEESSSHYNQHRLLPPVHQQTVDTIKEEPVFQNGGDDDNNEDVIEHLTDDQKFMGEFLQQDFNTNQMVSRENVDGAFSNNGHSQMISPVPAYHEKSCTSTQDSDGRTWLNSPEDDHPSSAGPGNTSIMSPPAFSSEFSGNLNNTTAEGSSKHPLSSGSSLRDLVIVPFDQLQNTLKPRNPNMKYVCPVCYKEFGNKGAFGQHYMIHTGEKPFVCPHCLYRTNRKTTLEKHMLVKHQRKRPEQYSPY